MSLVVGHITWGIQLLEQANLYSLTLEFSVLHSTSPGARATMFSNASLRNLARFMSARLLHRSVTRLRAERLNSTLEERIQECDRKLREEGRAEGIPLGIKKGIPLGIQQRIEQRIKRERELLCCMIGLKFDQDTEQRACRLLANVSDLDVLRKIQSWILECRAAADLLARMECSVSVLAG